MIQGTTEGPVLKPELTITPMLLFGGDCGTGAGGGAFYCGLGNAVGDSDWVIGSRTILLP